MGNIFNLVGDYKVSTRGKTAINGLKNMQIPDQTILVSSILAYTARPLNSARLSHAVSPVGVVYVKFLNQGVIAPSKCIEREDIEPGYYIESTITYVMTT
jgi:hypothetical protein